MNSAGMYGEGGTGSRNMQYIEKMKGNKNDSSRKESIQGKAAPL